MTVVLQPTFKKDTFIRQVNQELVTQYGAQHTCVFTSHQFVQDEADFFNHDPEGIVQATGMKRPVTAKYLSANFFWYRVGEYSCKITGSVEKDDVLNCIAVCKWIIATDCRYIAKEESNNFSKSIIHNYLKYYLHDYGIRPANAWQMP